jgi:hypothetical protein
VLGLVQVLKIAFLVRFLARWRERIEVRVRFRWPVLLKRLEVAE